MNSATVSSPLEVSPKDLSGLDWVKLWWGFLWRSLVVFACAMVVTMGLGFLTGAVAGILISVAGGDVKNFSIVLKLIGGALGLAVNVASFPFWLRWLLRAQFGRVRFALVGDRDQSTEPPSIGSPDMESSLASEAGQ